VQSPIPDGDNEVVVADGECAREVKRVSSAQRTAAGEPTSALFDISRQLYLSGRRPELFPSPLRVEQFTHLKIVVPR
jgi:hypothetical protein